jgi:hypothetical protein
VDLNKAIEEALRKADSESDPILVDFWDDVIYWDRIAKVAAAVAESQELHHDDKTLEKVKLVLYRALSTEREVIDIISNLQNEGILFRERS